MIKEIEVNGKALDLELTSEEKTALEVIKYKQKAERPLEEYIPNVAHALAKRVLDDMFYSIFWVARENNAIEVVIEKKERRRKMVKIGKYIEEFGYVQISPWFNCLAMFKTDVSDASYKIHMEGINPNERRPGFSFDQDEGVLLKYLASSIYSEQFKATFIEQLEMFFGKADKKWVPYTSSIAWVWKNTYTLSLKYEAYWL